MRKLVILLGLLLLCTCAMAEEYVVLNRTDNLTEEYQFEDDTPILEIIFPRVVAADCAIIRFGDEVMLLDSASASNKSRWRVWSAIQTLGIEEIDYAFNSHPHSDHIEGFRFVHEYAPLGKLYLTFPEDYDEYMIEAVAYANYYGVPIEHVGDGDVLTMGPNGEVAMRVYQRNDTGKWSGNNASAMLMVQYGDRKILFGADIENKAMASYVENPPAEGLKADILKYPHHGRAALNDYFLGMVYPELVFITGPTDAIEPGKEYLDKWHVPYELSYVGLTRMRTDGNIWVVDYLYELYPDRETIQPNYQ